MSLPTVSVKVWGDFALFTRPELKVERVSYPMMTPSAARGVLDAILYKPQMMWHVRRISVLRPMTFAGEIAKEVMDRPFRLVSFRRNEIDGRISVDDTKKWMKGKKPMVPFLVDSAGKEGVQGQNRTWSAPRFLVHLKWESIQIKILRVSI